MLEEANELSSDSCDSLEAEIKRREKHKKDRKITRSLKGIKSKLAEECQCREGKQKKKEEKKKKKYKKSRQHHHETTDEEGELCDSSSSGLESSSDSSNTHSSSTDDIFTEDKKSMVKLAKKGKKKCTKKLGSGSSEKSRSADLEKKCKLPSAVLDLWDL